MQAENPEKVARPPPFYSPTGSNAHPNALSGYTPNSQSPMPTGTMNGPMAFVVPMHTIQAGQTTSPMMAPGAIPPQQTTILVSPANLEAQIGSQYQAQMFARCARGEHDVVKKYGPCGIITGVLLFPVGLIALFIDVERKCGRCGIRLSK